MQWPVFIQRWLDRRCKNQIIASVGLYSHTELVTLALVLEIEGLTFRSLVPQEDPNQFIFSYPIKWNNNRMGYYYFNSFEKYMRFKLMYSSMYNIRLYSAKYNPDNYEVYGE